MNITIGIWRVMSMLCTIGIDNAADEERELSRFRQKSPWYM